MNQSKSVYIIGPTFGLDGVFPQYGYHVFTDSTVGNHDPDIVCWTGGADISPELYGEKQVSGTYPNPSRDKREVDLWNRFRDKPKLGICRGAQLLNVLNGGSMFQDVDRHQGNHVVTTKSGEQVLLCSVHHQLMIPAPNSELLAWTEISTTRESDKGIFKRTEGEVDPEVLFIPEDKALLFQAHPEFGPKSCTDYFFRLVKEYIA